MWLTPASPAALSAVPITKGFWDTKQNREFGTHTTRPGFTKVVERAHVRQGPDPLRC